MSTAVYYSNPNIQMDDVHARHTLPSLSQIVPMGQGQSGPSQQTSVSDQPVSPTMITNSMAPMNGMQVFSDQKVMYQSGQSSPELFSGGSQPSSAHTTPASSFSSQGSGSVVGAEKCTCKSNANRIPRPRNAFILFRQKYHQSVLDEGSVIRTNPEVSRELGKRWRSLTNEEKEHWNKMAEEEKKNHAKKYPGYRYTPRRNGKNKGCIACRQKALRQQQAQLHNQQILQMQQDQYQQYFQMQQQQSQLNQQTSLPQNSGYINNQPMGQFLMVNPYQQQQQQQQQQQPQQPQQTFQFSFNNDYSSNAQQDKLSPLQSVPSQYNYPSNQQEFMSSVPSNSSQFPYNYERSNSVSLPSVPITNNQPQNQNQRFNSLPTPIGGTAGSSNYGFDVFMSQQS